MMYGLEKSDSAIRAKKPANKAGQPVAEWAEQRAGTEGNTGQPHTRRTQSRGSVSQGLDRVRHVCRQPPEVGAVCPNWARTDLCGGCPVTGIPTAITALGSALGQRCSVSSAHQGLDDARVNVARRPHCR
jgi:hypothetical protein